jgi:hypothetical protein
VRRATTTAEPAGRSPDPTPGPGATETIAPPTVRDAAEARRRLRTQGYAVVPASVVMSGVDAPDLVTLASSWRHLPPDGYLRDGGRYRFRRHACWTIEPPWREPVLAPHRAHWQPTEYNALHGGLERWFEPVEDGVQRAPAFRALLGRLGAWFAAVRRVDRWYVESHQFRIDTASGIGRPTPEGAHRDGVDFVAVVLVQRVGVRGGETRVFDARGPAGERFTMSEPWSALLLDDARVIHETTPIQPAVGPSGGSGRSARELADAPAGSGADYGVRDTLVLTYRAGGFQSPG